MGATNFSTWATGKDANVAFRNAVEDARYEYGHGGYTGTIAEKSSFRLVDPKAHGFTLARFFKAMDAAEAAMWTAEDAKVDRWTKRTKAAQRKLDTKAKRAQAKLEKIAGSATGWILQLAKAADDKWGPALAVEITGKAGREYKERRGLKGKRCKVYQFWGMASE